MCTGRIDLAFVLRAFSKGADGVLIAGCHLNECNYTTHGNFYAISMTQLCKKMMEHIGANPDRLRIEFVSGGEANRFVEIVNGFSERILELGPLGRDEDLDASELETGLESLSKLVPYIKLQKKEKLRTRFTTKEEYEDLFTVEEIDQLLLEVASYYIDPKKCRACMMCAKRCPVEAIEGGKNRIHVIDQEKCIRCGRCLEVCPPRFCAVQKLSEEPVPPLIPEDERILIRKKNKASVDLPLPDPRLSSDGRSGRGG